MADSRSLLAAARAAELNGLVEGGASVVDAANRLGIAYVTAARYRSAAKRAAGIPSMKAEPGWRSQARVHDIERLRAEGKTRSQIAEALGVSRASIGDDMQRAGMSVPRAAPLGQAQIDHIASLRDQGLSNTEVVAELGVGYRRVMLAVAKSGRHQPRPARPRFTPDEIEIVRAAAAKGNASAATIAETINRSREQVSFHIRRLIAARELPEIPCPCGRPLFHVGNCSATSHTRTASGLPIVTASDREMVLRLLADGRRASEIADEIGFSCSQVTHLMRLLSPEDRARRARLRRPALSAIAVRARERASDILEYLAAGSTVTEIAKTMSLSDKAIRSYRRAALRSAGEYQSPRRTDHEKREMQRMAALGLNSLDIAGMLGLNREQVRVWLWRAGLIDRQWAGIPFTAKHEAELRQLMTSGENKTIRMLGEHFPHSLGCIGIHVRRLRPQLIARGALPRCECRKPLYHSRTCSPIARRANQLGLPYATPHKRRVVRARLIAGESVAKIAEKVRLSPAQVEKIFRQFSDFDRERRQISKGRNDVTRHRQAVVPSGDNVLDEIRAHMPSWIDQEDAQDIANDIYLAVIEKKVEASQVASVVRHFCRRFEKQFGRDRWSRIESMSDPLGDGDLDREGTVGDDYGAELVDEIWLGY